MPLLALVRHGESEANLKRLTAGQLDFPLTEHGHEQAQDTAALLKDKHFDYAFCSPLTRTKQTFAEIVDHLDSPLTFTYEPALMELNWGDMQGTSANDVPRYKIEHPEWFAWNTGAPGGETFAEASERIVTLFESKVRPLLNAGHNVLLVGHEGIFKALQRYLEDSSYETFQQLALKNCEIKFYEIDGSGKVLSIAKERAPEARPADVVFA